MAEASTLSSVPLVSVEGGVTAPLGFHSSSLHCGIKQSAPDLVVIASTATASAAGLFTTNLVRAAPVLVSEDHLARTQGRARAVVVNSGCANACTGETGMRDAVEMATLAATALGCSPDQVLVASTGVIGVALKMSALRSGIPSAIAKLARGKGGEAARGIMTTDAFPKEHAVTVRGSRGTFTVGGMAKGAGMIEPNMATMLGFLTTDAAVPPAILRRALVEAARDTFNAITVDGDTSTNDSLFALASGDSGITIDEQNAHELVEALRVVSLELAVAIVRGGEGATKVIQVRIRGAADETAARRVAKTIANSLLVKTAVHGADPNWGRILAAAGRAGVPFNVQQATVRVGGVLLFENGLPHDEGAPEAAKHLQGQTVDIDVDLGVRGGADTTVWTCDLSAEYVRINGEYRT